MTGICTPGASSLLSVALIAMLAVDFSPAVVSERDESQEA